MSAKLLHPKEHGSKKLVFDPTPHCCGKPLGNDDPTITCPVCHTEYNADDILEIMLEISAGGKRPIGDYSENIRKR
jgi:hypothetical protein